MQTSNINSRSRGSQDPQKVSKLLAKSTLGQLIERAFYLLSLQEALYLCLPEGITSSHCRVANLNGNTLVVEAEQAHVSTRLRYQQFEILEKLNARLPGVNIQTLQVRVRPGAHT
jgi:hypothetical protein